MAIEQLIRMQCEYCKTATTLPLPFDPQQVSDWIEARLWVESQQNAPLQPAILTYCSAKCASQAFKLLAESKARVVASDVPNRKREVIRVNEEGQTEVLQSEPAGVPSQV